MSVLLDPRFFNFVIMSLYALNIGRWTISGYLWAAGYWMAALGITICATFGKLN
jgi:hypothetical protein